MPRTEIEHVRFRIDRTTLGDGCAGSGVNSHSEPFGDAARDFILDGDNVAKIAIKRLGPDVVAVGGVNKLRSNADLLAGLANTTFEQHRHAQDFSDFARILVPTLEGEGGIARRHLETRSEEHTSEL